MKKILLWTLLAASLTLSLANLGGWALMDADEAIYARVFHESSERRDFSSFTYLGQPWFEKPPLYFWLTRASVAAFGENEFALRFPSAISVTAAVLLVWLIVRRLTKDDIAAFLAGAILLSTGLFAFAGRQVRLDVPVAAAALFAFYSFLKAREDPRWFFGFGAGVAAGILLKSVIGLLAFPVIFIYSCFSKSWDWLKNKRFWLGNLFALLLVLPWHADQHFRFGAAFWNSYFWFHVVKRAGSTVVFGEQAPFLYHLKQLFIAANPWFFVFLILGARLLLKKKSGTGTDRPEAALFAIALFILVLFYIPQTRLLYYFVPALPFLAMGVAVACRRLLMKKPRVAAVTLILFIAVGFAGTFFRIFSQKERDIFLRTIPKVSRYAVAEDEKAAAIIVRKEAVPFYVYNWRFFPTLLYYGNGAEFAVIKNGGSAAPPFLLLIPTPLFRGTGSLPIKIPADAKTEILYQGEAAVLVKVPGSF